MDTTMFAFQDMPEEVVTLSYMGVVIIVGAFLFIVGTCVLMLIALRSQKRACEIATMRWQSATAQLEIAVNVLREAGFDVDTGVWNMPQLATFVTRISHLQRRQSNPPGEPGT